MIALLSFLLFLAPNADNVAKPEDSVMRVSVDEVRTALEHNDVVLLDVRGDVPYELQHIHGAISMPLGLVAQRAAELPQDKLIVAYCTCTHDEQSVAAVLELQQAGVMRAAALRGGMTAWKAADLPLDVQPPQTGDFQAAAVPQSGRVMPPAAVKCNRSDVTSYNGRVELFRKAAKSTTIRIATEWATTETVTAVKPVYLVDGKPMKTADWKRAGIGQGGRANVWVCRTGTFEPVIDWRPDQKGRE
jgi:rhodanese-related sulfurtransferase